MGAALGYVVHPVLKPLGILLHFLVFPLPAIPAAPKEPDLHPPRGLILRLAVLRTLHIHVRLLVQVFNADLRPTSATNPPKRNKPKTAKSSTVFISPPPTPLPLAILSLQGTS